MSLKLFVGNALTQALVQVQLVTFVALFIF